MFKRLKKLTARFVPKKIVIIPIEDIIAEVTTEAKNYSLIQDNDDIDALFKNKFKTKTGAQVPPKEFMTKIIAHIENNPPLTPEVFAHFVRETIKTFSIATPARKNSFWRKK